MDQHRASDADGTRKRPLGTPAVLTALVLGAVIGGMAVEYWLTRGAVTETGAQTASASVLSDVERLKQLQPTQSHTMIDVGYHWASLWFAVERKNWPLAAYFFAEARQSVRWTVLLRPERKLPDGGTVNIKGIFDAVDPSAFATVQLAIEDKDAEAFTMAYRQALEACYTCHKAAGRPELRPMVPTVPPTTLINFDPAAKWPE